MGAVIGIALLHVLSGLLRGPLLLSLLRLASSGTLYPFPSSFVLDTNFVLH
jgi:hypothetical protein